MKNILSINMENDRCNLISSINDGTNKIVLNIKADISLNPKISFFQTGTTEVSIKTSNFVYEIPDYWITGSGKLTFRIIDDRHTSEFFEITQIKAISGNVILKKISNYSYTLSSILEIDPVIDKIYRIGTIYETTDNSFDPNVEWGGTWNRIKGKVLVGVDENDGDFNAAGKTGGSKTKSYTPSGTVGGHTLTANEMPVHAHSLANHTHGFSATSAVAGAWKAIFHMASKSNNRLVAGYGSAYGAKDSGTTDRMISSGLTTISQNDMLVHDGHSHSISGTTGGNNGNTGNNGGGASHNHGFTGTAANINVLQPYETCYIWKRTA